MSRKPDHRPSNSSANSKSRQRRSQRPTETQGLAARRLGLFLTEGVLRHHRSLDEALEETASEEKFSQLSSRDRAFARLIAATVLRRHGELQRVIDPYLAKPLPQSAIRIRLILLCATAQLLVLKSPAHAVISTSVELARLSRKTAHFDKLTNAVLRRVSEAGASALEDNANPNLNFPDWMIEGWRRAYGTVVANRIAAASLLEAPLDISVKDNPDDWASQLEASVLATGSLRRPAGGLITELPGFDEGAWWVQDAAAALPAKLLAAQKGERVLDMCAAPGGKTAQLASAGAQVTAIDSSAERLKRLQANMTRLGLIAECVAADATTWRGSEPFDAILLDSPCTATGTIRRHPDIPHLKQREDVARLAEIQANLLANAASLLRPGGRLVYCTCSLEPAEGLAQVEQFLERQPIATARFERQPITLEECWQQSDWITSQGDVRTLPFHLPNEDARLAGMDGFFVSRLVRIT